MLELTIKSSKGQSTTAAFVIVYSPFTDRDRQVGFYPENSLRTHPLERRP